MRFVDLFCGLGGGALGALDAGLEPIGLIDNLIDCKNLLCEDLSPFFVHSDLSELTPVVSALVSKADVLLCSPPCQSFSTLTSQNRTAKPSAIDDAFLQTIWRAAALARPTLLIVENVPAFLRYEDSKKLKLKIESLGYFVEFNVMDAGEMGVPQRRKRAIMIASKTKPKMIGVKETLTVRDAFDGLQPLNSADPLHQNTRKHTQLVQRRIEAIPKDGGSRSALPAALRLACHENTSGFNDVYGRMAWDKVSPTITSGCTNPSKGRFIHPVEDRAITLREAARLQTLPDSIDLEGITSIESKARLIGNAFPPEFAKNLILQNL